MVGMLEAMNETDMTALAYKLSPLQRALLTRLERASSDKPFIVLDIQSNTSYEIATRLGFPGTQSAEIMVAFGKLIEAGYIDVTPDKLETAEDYGEMGGESVKVRTGTGYAVSDKRELEMYVLRTIKEEGAVEYFDYDKPFEDTNCITNVCAQFKRNDVPWQRLLDIIHGLRDEGAIGYVRPLIREEVYDRKLYTAQFRVTVTPR